MTNVKSVNFYDLCRICTATTDQKIDIFSFEGKTKNLCAKINECLALNIDEKDRLPKVLCPQCIQHLESYSEFRNICRNSQIMLNSCLNTASAQNGGKVLIKDILSSTGKSLSVFNSVGINNNVDNLQNLTTQTLNQSLAPQLQQTSQPQQLFTIQGANVMGQSVVNPLAISASGTLQNRDFINSIMHAVGIQSDHIKVEKSQTVPQYTITVDNNTVPQQAQTQTNLQPVTPNKDKEHKNNSLEEFLRMKPNIKVTPVSKKLQQQNQNQQQYQQQQHEQQHQQQQQLQHEQQQFQQQQNELHQQQLQQQEQQQQQNQLVQFQLQQLLQQQLQQQQLQQQLQLLTSQLQPQQITITTPSLQQQQPTILQSTALTAENSLNDNDDQSPPKNKKPKLNFILTPPNQQTTHQLNATLPQISTITTAPNTSHPTTPQIQLQFHPTLTPQTALQLQQTQHQNATTAALLSNLAPLLHPQNQLNAALQTQALNNVTQNSGTNMLSPNKCFLPITIKDENTDQQFVAHIDAKNFLLPTTYQLQMKLQPQIATADGQPIMQLAPTSIPATLQLAPQTINANSTFQAAAAAAAFNNNSTLPTQLIHQQQQQQTQQIQTAHTQQQVPQQVVNTPGQQQSQDQPKPTPPSTQAQAQAQTTQMSQLPKNAQITSQQVLTTGNKKLTTPSVPKIATDASNLNEAEKHMPKTRTVSQSSSKESRHVIKQQKYTISQLPGTNTIEITPTTSFTQQIMQQVQQQQQQKQKQNQQQISAEPSTTATVTTQHGGITVQRIMTKNNSTAASSASLTNENVAPSTRQATITPLHQQTKQPALKLPILNKQNITISRIAPHNQQQQQKSQNQHPQTTTQITNTNLKVVHQPIKSQTTTTKVASHQKQQQALPTRTQQQQVKQSTQHEPQVISNIPTATVRISPVKKVIKKSQHKLAETSQTTATTDALPRNTNQQQQRQRQQQRTENHSTTQPITPPASTTQIHYVTDITSVLPPSNDDQKLATGTKISTVTMPASTTITSTNPSNTTSSIQAKSNLECTECGRVFKKKEHLTQHVKLHSGVRPFKCSEEGCSKAFHRKEHLLRHLVSHSGKKMFSCDICQKPFSRKDNLSKHRKIHTDPNNSSYICEFCNKSFAVKAYYDQHKILHQSKTKPEEDKKTVSENSTKIINQSSNIISSSNSDRNQIEYQTQQQQQQQLHLVQQQIQQLQQQNQTQSQQIMHLQLPTSIVTSQDMVGNTITITQANDNQAHNLKTITLSAGTGISAAGGGNHHDATVLNLPTSLANFVQLSQTQFVNATTGQIMGLKIEK